jgi:adenosylcobinamide kinase / adenosylcobinamide-phosphate guanylyltransferase
VTPVGELLFVTGGARSGKSAFAERLASKLGERSDEPVVYVATLEPLDDEMRDRVARHRERRPDGWATVEAPRDLLEALRDAPDAACILADCLSVWLANCLLALGEDPAPGAVESFEGVVGVEADAVIECARERTGSVIVVSNEVGSGVVPPYPLGRIYRDALGRLNQRLSSAADRAWVVVAGRAIELPPPF